MRSRNVEPPPPPPPAVTFSGIDGSNSCGREVNDATKSVQNQRVPSGIPANQDCSLIRIIASKWYTKSTTGQCSCGNI